MPGDFFPRLEDQGLIRDQDKQWVAQQTFSAQKIITGSLQADQEVSSSNFVSGTSGWQIDGDGNAEFNDMVVRGSIINLPSGTSFPASPSDGDLFYRTDSNKAYRYDGTNWHAIDALDDENRVGTSVIASAAIQDAAITTAKIGDAEVTNAKIDTLAASKITAGTINTGTINVASLLQISSGGTFQTAASGNRRIRLRSTVTDRIEFVSTTDSVMASLILNSDNELFIDASTAAARLILYDTNDPIHVGDPVSGAGNGLQVNAGNITLTGGGNLDINNGNAHISSPSGEVALTAYRQQTTQTDDVAHFRSDRAGNTDSLVALVKVSGNLENFNNSYGGISDARLKENIETARPYLDDLRKIRITKHTMKATGQRLLGPIAQEVRDIFPGLVSESDWDGEKVLTVKHSVFVPMLITAVQELANRVEELEAVCQA